MKHIGLLISSNAKLYLDDVADVALIPYAGL